jgi:hypothetical protein
MRIAAGEELTCPCGTKVGRFVRAVKNDAPIVQADLEIDQSVTKIGDLEWLCSRCDRSVAQTQNGKWRVHTARGWLS